MTHYYGLDTVLDPNNIVVSHSDLSSFKRDRLRWFLTTYLGIRPKGGERPVSPLVLGSMVHNAMELHYRDGMDLHDAYRKTVRDTEAKYRKTYPYFPVHEWTKQAKLGAVMLEGYEDWLAEENHDHDVTVIDIERYLEVPATYHGRSIKLIGKADMVVRNNLNNEILIYDFKTTANIARTKKAAHTTEQLPYYCTLEQALVGPTERVTAAAFTILLKSQRTARSTPPYFAREYVRYGPAEMKMRQQGIDGAVSDYVRVISQLHDGVTHPLTLAYPSPGNIDFDGGTYDVIMDVLMSGGHIGDLVRERYTQITPYDRYGADISAPEVLE